MDPQTQQAIGYIQQLAAQGFSEPQIRARLLESGWQPPAVDNLFTHYRGQSALPLPAYQPPDLSAPAGGRRASSKWILAAVAIIVMLGAAFAIHLATPPRSPAKAAQSTTSSGTKSTAQGQSALQQASANVSRKNDINVIASAVAEYSNNNGGAMPQQVAVTGDSSILQICGTDCTAAADTSAKLSHYQASAVSLQAYASDLRVPDAETIYMVEGAACNDSKSGIGAQGTAQQVVFLYATAAGSKAVQQCLAL